MCVSYEEFDIIDVAQKCGITFYGVQRNNIELKALCPFCNDTKYHLGLNRQKGRFHCFRCGEKGNSVSLYAKIFGLTNKEAYKAIKDNVDVAVPTFVYAESMPEVPMRSLQERHNVYYDFLRLLRLQDCHRENLTNRGLLFSDIHRFMYRSLPTDRVFRREVLEKLSSVHDLMGIPGFYVDECGDWQMYLSKHGGILIPVCNKDGYIQGLQIRLDVPEGLEDKKFRWFSSRYFKNGTNANAWIHVVGDTNSKEACLTEGAMKADIASVLSNGRLFLAVPGVSSINLLPEVIKDLGIQRIYEAFDMDKRAKAEVKAAWINLKNLLSNSGVECISCSWNPIYNGLDDYILAKTRVLSRVAA